MSDSKVKILIACDHAGFELKKYILSYLQNHDYEVEDLGCESSTISVDYPDFAQKTSQKIKESPSKIAILICGSGIGISIAANRFRNMRAALCCNEEMAKMSRLHNDANAICFGARMIEKDTAICALETFLNTQFEGKRHAKRIEKIS